jgi:RNA polymerase sigma factor (TIGR02999 family)
MPAEPKALTILLHRWRDGDKEAEAQLFRLMMPELRRIAGHCFRDERIGHTMQPTALINEAFLRLAVAKNIDWHDRGHFLAVAARMMRRYLIDHARGRTLKFVAIADGMEPAEGLQKTPLEVVLTLDHLLDELEVASHRMCSVVELKYFLGLTDGEAAKVLHISQRSTEREWHNARRWLFQRLSKDDWKLLSKTMNA